MIELKEESVFNAKAIIVEPRYADDSDSAVSTRLDEMKSLCSTMGLNICEVMIAPIKSVKAATFIGSGKLEELVDKAAADDASIAVMDCELSPTQQLNMEERSGLCVIDRQEVIIQIFADRAQTKEAMIQVNLASLKYSLPRLTRKWTSLSQTRGGVRGGKGAGEKKLELDRRYVESRIKAFSDELEKVKRQRNTQRQSRLSSPIPKIAIVGYTNSGKSSLLNKLSASDVLAEDKLFATLDPVTRKLNFNDGSQALLTDTVGFVSNLPHHLIDSFRSTLEEACLADMLLIVADATHPSLLSCFHTTMEVLQSLGCIQKNIVIAINKMDVATEDCMLQIARLESEAIKATGQRPIRISARTSEGLDDLKEEMKLRLR